MKWFTAKELAPRIGLSYREFIKRVIKTGRCKYFRIGPEGNYRVREDWFQKFFDEYTHGDDPKRFPKAP